MGNIGFFIDETSKLLKPKGLDTLILYVTSRCNAKCNFCFYGDELNRIPELDLSDIIKIAENLKSLKGLLIGGGEPFLRTDLFEIISGFVKNCNIQVVQIPTNGYFTDRVVSFVENVKSSFPHLNLSIQISLDAIGAKHDEVRELKNCFKKAEETIAALKALKDQDTRLRFLVVSVLTPETITTCRELAGYVREKIDPDYHWFEPVRDMPNMQENLDLTDDTIKFLQDNLHYYLTKTKGTSSSVYASWLLNNLITEFSLSNFRIAYDNFSQKKRWPVPCCASKRMAVLYPDGVLAACELRKESVNVRDYDFNISKALENDVFKKVRQDTSKHLCDCTHGCFIPTSVRYSPAELSKIFLKSTFHKSPASYGPA